MAFYWLLVVLFVLLLYVIHASKRNAKNFLLLLTVLALFLLLVTFRPLETQDTEGYAEIFDKIYETDYSELFGTIDLIRKEPNTGTEYGFVFLIKALQSIIPYNYNYRLFFFLIALIEFVFVSLFARNMLRRRSKRVDFYYYFLPYFGLMYSLVVIRGGLCLCICLFAFAFSKRKKRNFFFRHFISLVFYFIAFTIHRFALIFLIVEIIYYFFPKLKKKETYIVWWLAFGLVVLIFSYIISAPLSSLLQVLFSSNELLSHYAKYIDVQGGLGSFSFRSLFFWLLGGLVLFGTTDKQFLARRSFFNIYLVGLLVIGVFSFVPGASRISDYFFVFIPLMLVDLDYSVNKKNYYSVLQSSEIIYGVLGTIIMVRL